MLLTIQRLRPIARAAQPARVLSAVADATDPAEKFVKHRNLMMFEGKKVPRPRADTFVAPNCTIVGDVKINSGASVLYNTVIRGDLNEVRIGWQSQVGEGCVISTKESLETGFPAIVDIKPHVKIGPGCTLVSCTVMPRAIIGERCVVLEGALVEAGAVLGAGSVVPPGRRVPAGQVWAGNPAQYVGEVEDDSLHTDDMRHESELMWDHLNEFLPQNTVYEHAEELKLPYEQPKHV